MLHEMDRGTVSDGDWHCIAAAVGDEWSKMMNAARGGWAIVLSCNHIGPLSINTVKEKQYIVPTVDTVTPSCRRYFYIAMAHVVQTID